MLGGVDGRVRHGQLGWHREHPARDEGLPRPRAYARGIAAAGDDRAVDRARRVRQGAPTTSASRRCTVPVGADGRADVAATERRDHAEHRGDRRFRAVLPERARRPDRGARRAGARRATSASTPTPASAASCCRGRSSSATRCRRSTSAFPASPRCRPTRTSTATRPRARRSCCTATRTCATSSTTRTADWAGGLYFSPTFAGSRPGALSAACWAAMLSIGEEGYLDATRRILEAAQRVKEGLAKIEGVDVIGDPLLERRVHDADATSTSTACSTSWVTTAGASTACRIRRRSTSA